MKSIKVLAINLMAALVLAALLLQPITVHADGETPPPAETEEPTEPAPDPGDGAQAVQEPADVDSPPEALAAPDSEAAAAEEPAGTGEPTLPEILEELPEGTSLVVLDENGQPEPLATQAAADSLASSDPMWCPDASKPGGPGCTSSYSTMKDLLDNELAYIDSQVVSGTIWIAAGAIGDTANVVIDGTASPNWHNFGLTLQGGLTVDAFGNPVFDADGNPVIGSNSVFIVPITITGWVAPVTVNNLTINNAADNGLSLDSFRDISVNNTTVDNAAQNGLSAASLQNISINNSTFSNNDYDGAYVAYANNVNVTNSTFHQNDGHGLYVTNAGKVDMTGSTFSQNQVIGAYVTDASKVSIANSTFTQNPNNDGANLWRISDDITITGSTFSKNGYDGVGIVDSNSATITGSSFTGNYYRGAYASNTSNLTIASSILSENEGPGMWVNNASSVSITGSTFNRNIEKGAIIDADNLSISGSEFNENHQEGIYINNTHDITITDSVFSGNLTSGLHIFAGTGYQSALSSTNSVFQDNNTGIYAHAFWDHSVTMPPGEINLSLYCSTCMNNKQDIVSTGDGIVTVTSFSCANPPPPPPVCDGCNIIYVPADTDNIEFPIGCSMYSLYIALWPSGDRVEVACLDDGLARISRLDNASLSELPSGFQYVSAYKVDIFQNGEPVLVTPASGYIYTSFVSRHTDPQYDILHWDAQAGEWIVLKEFQVDPNGRPVVFPLEASNPADARKILKGVRWLDAYAPFREEVTVNFTGILALVQH